VERVVTQDDILAALARLNVTPEERAREARLQGRLQEARSGTDPERRQAIERALSVSSAGATLLREQMDDIWQKATADRVAEEQDPERRYMALLTRAESLERANGENIAILSFRMACDAAHVEGQLARSVGMDLGANPYVGDEPATRICPDRTLGEFHIPWMLGWREADEQDAIDALVVAAEAATRGGTVTPACPAGEGLREAVAALMARRLRS
jgi:hypothetical protein